MRDLLPSTDPAYGLVRATHRLYARHKPGTERHEQWKTHETDNHRKMSSLSTAAGAGAESKSTKEAFVDDGLVYRSVFGVQNTVLTKKEMETKSVAIGIDGDLWYAFSFVSFNVYVANCVKAD